MSDEMSSDEILNYLDWENDEGWVAAPGPHGVVQFVPRDFFAAPQASSGSAVPVILVMTAVAIPFWLLAAYGLWCLVTH